MERRHGLPRPTNAVAFWRSGARPETCFVDMADLKDDLAALRISREPDTPPRGRRVVRENEVRRDDSRRTLARRRQLAADKLVTQADVDAAEADVDSYEARIAAARAQIAVAERQIEVERANLDNTIVRAPFSGVA